ncbi:YHYH protein [Aureibaculum luteum]|uniref:YHYH protein n=1 Tax=Aureibaculum luteum TaxID=1548456 RepID=UPI000E5474BE|nr:YHYH protein [Aureibaculum luteum]
MIKTNFNKALTVAILLIITYSCNLKSNGVDASQVKVVDVNPDYFIKDALIVDIVKKEVDLKGGKTLCYVIKTHSQPTEHNMGPWCPRHISDGKEKGGLWFREGKVYDVDGHFIADLDKFYNDDRWNLFRENDSIKVTTSKEACEGAAKPDVEDEYQNHCVECLPEYYEDQITTYTIPVTPVYNNRSRDLSRNGLGLAFNGVNYDPPAPVHAILAAHTLAPLDDHGGHVNPHGGYHYHAATGSTKEIEQTDTHAPMLGYAIDGFGIYALTDKKGEKPTDLDNCGGHQDDVRGYHYHAGEVGGNEIIKCLHGEPGQMVVQE